MSAGQGLDPLIFAPDGNRKRGFRCGPCIKHKKGCRGNPPVCDSCKNRNSAHKCDFSREAIEAAYKAQRAKHSIPRLTTSSSFEFTESSDEPRSSPLQRKRKATSPLTHRTIINPIHKQTELSQRAQSVPTSQTLDKTSTSFHVSDLQTTTPSIYRMSASTQTPQPSSLSRINQQKRTMDSLSEAEISQARNPLTRKFIRKYHAPFSRNLLPMLEEIVNGMIDKRASDDAKAVYTEIKAFFTYVWTIVLECMAVQEQQKLAAKQLTSENNLATRGPVTEREVEEFFFAYMCILASKGKEETVWDTAAQARAKKWCVEIVDTNWLYLRDCLEWHRQNKFSYDMRANWLMEWLPERAAEQNNDTTNARTGST